MALKDYSTTPGSNNSASPNGAPEGMAPSGVNDTIRQIMADIRAALYNKGSDIASASTTDLAAATTEGLFHDITGTTTITSLGTVAAGVHKAIKFEGALTLTHNATSLILPGGANITTADGDIAWFVSEGSGNWRCLFYSPATGRPIVRESTPCQGRLTLTSGTPVTTADVTGAGTIYFTPYKGNTIATYSGTAWSISTFTEKSLALTLTSGKPYDIFIVHSTLALESLVWTNDTTRATALALQDGVYVKNGDATCRYLGTIYSSGANTTEDSAAKRYVWNYYNRVMRSMRVTEATDSWTYTTATIRQANNSTSNQLNFVIGYNEDAVIASVTGRAENTGAAVAMMNGIGLDSTSAIASGCMVGSPLSQVANNAMETHSEWRGFPGVGKHYLAWLEFSSASGTTTWYGDAGFPTRIQTGIHGEIQA